MVTAIMLQLKTNIYLLVAAITLLDDSRHNIDRFKITCEHATSSTSFTNETSQFWNLQSPLLPLTVERRHETRLRRDMCTVQVLKL